MAFRELRVVEIKEILRLWALGHGLRYIADRTGADRKTVRRYIEAARKAGFEPNGTRLLDDELIAEVAVETQPGAPSTPGAMRELLRQHAEQIQGWVDEGCRGPKLVKLVERTLAVKVPLRTIQRFVSEDLTARSKDDSVPIVDPPPGQVLEVDFLKLGQFDDLESGKRLTLHALLCVAPNSRHEFVWPCLSETLDDVIEGLEAAWAFFGGVFPVLLPDNLSPVVNKADRVDPTFTEAFIEYAQARDFEPDPTRVRKPRDKARVERQVRYVRDDYFRGERFRSLEEARDAARRWATVDAGMRIHGRTRRRPYEVFETDEKPLLKPAPTEPYDRPIWTDHRVRRDNHIVVDGAVYTVPYTVTDTDLRVRRDRKTVKLYAGAVLIKVHPRQPRGGSHIDPADLPPHKAALATRDTEALCEQAGHWGPHVGEYARRLTEGPHMWRRMRQIYRLMGLAKKFGGASTDRACAQALEADVVDVMRIQRMLENGLVGRNPVNPRPPEAPPEGKLPRFARRKDEFRSGGPNAVA